MGDLLFSFDGRIKRKQFWIGFAILCAVAILLGLVVAFLSTLLGFLGRLISLAVLLAFLYPSMALAAKRIRDRGRDNVKPWLAAYFGPGLVSNVAQTFGIGFEEQRFGDIATTAPTQFGLILLFLGFVAFVVAVVDLGCLKDKP